MHESKPVGIKQIVRTWLILVAGTIILGSCSRYEVLAPNNWSDGIKVTKSRITEARTVEDWKAGSTLFTYYEFPMAQPIVVQSIDGDRWITVFEKPPVDRANSAVRIERVGENEYRVVILPPKEAERPK